MAQLSSTKIYGDLNVSQQTTLDTLRANSILITWPNSIGTRHIDGINSNNTPGDSTSSGSDGQLYLNYNTTGNINLCRGGGTVELKGGRLAPLKNTNGHWGLCDIDGGESSWIRTTVNGLLPFNSGGASSLGTSSWPFANIFASNIYDNGVLLEDKFVKFFDKAGVTTDMNNLVTPGVYHVQLETTINKPSGEWGTCYVSFVAHTLWIQQLWMGQFGNIYVRHSNDAGGTINWNPWKKMLDSTSAVATSVNGNILGTASGNWDTSADAKLHCNLRFYDYEVDNWAGIGTDSGGNIRIRTGVDGSHGAQFRFSGDGSFTAPRVYNAVYNDYAEYFEKDDLNETFEPGDIIVSHNDKYTKSTKEYQKNVIGVCSDSYGHILGGIGNIEEDNKNCIPVGLAGRVFVKVVGKVEEGDVIVSSNIPGVGMVANEFKMGTIIGKAVQSKDTDEIGKVKIVICLS